MSTDFLAGIIFVAVFGGVILVHELGHFFVGRFFGVEVEEFGIGLPPKILTLFHWKETEFTLNWLPVGGFNRFKGENDPEVEGGLAAASPGVRLAVLLAGATMNLLTGIFVYSVIISQIGVPNFDIIQVWDVSPDSPAAQAGFRSEDIVLAINGEKITGDDQLRTIIAENMDKELHFTLQRGDEIVETVATPLSSRSAEEGALGFIPGYAYQESPSLLTTLSYGVQTTYYTAKEILLLPARMLRGTLSPEEGRFIGFKGIFNIFQQTVDADVESRVDEPTGSAAAAPTSPTYYTLNLIASLTITLGVFNLLPFPALDGGRIFFLLPELLFKKRVPPKFENLIHGVGMILLLGFMVYINVMDFVNPIEIALP
jgi:regulator of sigma E protease